MCKTFLSKTPKFQKSSRVKRRNYKSRFRGLRTAPPRKFRIELPSPSFTAAGNSTIFCRWLIIFHLVFFRFLENNIFYNWFIMYATIFGRFLVKISTHNYNGTLFYEQTLYEVHIKRLKFLLTFTFCNFFIYFYIDFCLFGCFFSVLLESDKFSSGRSWVNQKWSPEPELLEVSFLLVRKYE